MVQFFAYLSTNRTIKNHSNAMVFLLFLMKGLEKEGAKFRAGLEPAETQAKIVQRTILLTRLAGGSLHPHQWCICSN